jgi:hypothetical protein
MLTLIHFNVQIGFFQPTILRLPRHRAEKARSNLAQSCYRDREGSCRKGACPGCLFLGLVRIPVNLTTRACPCGRSSG